MNIEAMSEEFAAAMVAAFGNEAPQLALSYAAELQHKDKQRALLFQNAAEIAQRKIRASEATANSTYAT